MTLNDSERQTVINALRTAADCYQEDAETCSANPRLVAQFEKQARDADALADKLEDF